MKLALLVRIVPALTLGAMASAAAAQQPFSHELHLKLPQKPAQASFFSQQAATYDG